MTTEEKDAEIERLKALAEKSNADTRQYLTALTSAEREVQERRKAMADIVRALGHGCHGLGHSEIVPEIERLKGYLERANWRRCDIPACNCNGYHNWNPSREEIEEPLCEEIERLKGELAEAFLLMEQGRECLRQLVALANVNAETRKMLRYLGNTFNLFLQKHTPPLNCGSAAAGESPSHSGGGDDPPIAYYCEREYKCRWQAFSMHQGLAWGTIPHATEPWFKCHSRECGGKLIQIYASKKTGKSALREVPPTGGAS